MSLPTAPRIVVRERRPRLADLAPQADEFTVDTGAVLAEAGLAS